jgi:hypothetical protein
MLKILPNPTKLRASTKMRLPVARHKLFGTRCTICRGPHAAEISLALISGQSARVIAATFGYSKSGVLRHGHNCVPRTLMMAKRSKEIGEGEFIKAELCNLVERTKLVMHQAEKSGHVRSFLSAVREIRGLYEVISRPSAQSTAEAQVNVSVAPGLEEFRKFLMAELERYPEQRDLVAQALRAAANSQMPQLVSEQATSSALAPPLNTSCDHSAGDSDADTASR